MAADDFQALEERVLRTVELLKGERELRFSVEQHASRLSHRVEEQAAHVAQLEEQLAGLQKEREAVRCASIVCSSKLTKWAIDRGIKAIDRWESETHGRNNMEVRRTSTSVSVDIYDQTYHLRAPDPDYIQRLANTVDAKMRPSPPTAIPSIRCAWPCSLP